MEKIVFHIIVNATVIGTLKTHREICRRSPERKIKAFGDAQKQYIKRRIHGKKW